MPWGKTVAMRNDRGNDETARALQSVLDAMIDPINQLFLHSRMLRAWGHSLGATRNMEWVEKMRRPGDLAVALHRHGASPQSREARDLEIGHDPASILAADAAQTRWFLGTVEAALARCPGADDRALLERIAAAEREDLARLEAWGAGPQAREARRGAKFLLPKPGVAEIAVAAINAVLPAMTASVSQFFHHSLMFRGDGDGELAERELAMALVMMYRSEAMLERLLDLGGIPEGRGHGRVRIGQGASGADTTAVAALDALLAALQSAREPVNGIVDPTTHTLLDGITRALRDDRAAIAARLAA